VTIVTINVKNSNLTAIFYDNLWKPVEERQNHSEYINKAIGHGFEDGSGIGCTTPVKI